MTTAPKYWHRDLKEHEEERFEELRILFEKYHQCPYWFQVVNDKTNETLMDIACSTNRYTDLSKYYQKGYEERRKKEMENEDRELSQDEKAALGICNNGDENPGYPMPPELVQIKDLWDKHLEICHEACHLMLDRNKKYWDFESAEINN